MWITVSLLLCLTLLHKLYGVTVDECKNDGWTIAPRPGEKAICFKAFVENRNFTFDEANTICTWNGAVPAPMQTKDDAKAVIDAMKQTFHKNHYLFGERYQVYLGAYHTALPEGSHGKFHWIMDKTAVDGNYTLWDVGQPDIDSQHISQHEDCLMFRWHPNQEEQTVRWHDVACDCKAENKCYEATGGIVCAKIAEAGSTERAIVPDNTEKCHDGSQKSAIVVAIDASWHTMDRSSNHSFPAQLQLVDKLFKFAGECDQLKVIFYAGKKNAENGRCRSALFIKSDKLRVEDLFDGLFTREEYYQYNPLEPMRFWWSAADCTVDINTKKFFWNAPGFRRIFILIGVGGLGQEQSSISNHVDGDSHTMQNWRESFEKFLKKNEAVKVITITQTTDNVYLMQKVASNSEKDAFAFWRLDKTNLNDDLVEDVWERIRNVKT